MASPHTACDGRLTPAEEAELGTSSTRIGLVVPGCLIAIFARPASAQVTPAAAVTPPDDTPSIRVGMTLFPTYAFQTIADDHGCRRQLVNRNAFDVARAYINITGNISHMVAFRLTPDITRESGLLTLGARQQRVRTTAWCSASSTPTPSSTSTTG